MQLLISFDTTGSMRPALVETLRRINTFVDDIHTVIPNAEIALIAHGDYRDYYDPKVCDFTTNVTTLKNFLQTCGTTSGFGNGGECYEWVMHIASSLRWAHDQKIFIMIGDEPAHGITNYSRSGRYAQYDWRTEINNILRQNITFYQVRCLNRDDSRAYHKELAAIAQTPLLSLAQFNDIVEVLTAVAYKQHSNEVVEQYAQILEGEGRLNRNLATIIDDLLGKKGNYQATQTNVDLEAVDPSRFQMMNVDKEIAIKAFVENLGIPYKKGRGFYELTKMETIQENKEVVLRHKITGDMFSGNKARELIGLPFGQRGRITRSRYFDYDVFVQSTSVNRVLMPRTRFLYET